jgi:hypothetical protein
LAETFIADLSMKATGGFMPGHTPPQGSLSSSGGRGSRTQDGNFRPQ